MVATPSTMLQLGTLAPSFSLLEPKSGTKHIFNHQLAKKGYLLRLFVIIVHMLFICCLSLLSCAMAGPKKVFRFISFPQMTLKTTLLIPQN